MGRPPIGKQAMTSTERSWRRRARLRADQPATKYATKLDAAAAERIAELEQELVHAKARIAELEQELSTAAKQHYRDKRRKTQTRAG
jgi:hypothetical protein